MPHVSAGGRLLSPTVGTDNSAGRNPPSRVRSACLLAFDGTDLILHYTKIDRIYVSHIEHPTRRTDVLLADTRYRPLDER